MFGLGQLTIEGEEVETYDGAGANAGGTVLTRYDLSARTTPMPSRVPPTSGAALSSWLSSSFDFFGLHIPNVLGLAAVVVGAIIVAKKK